MDILLPRRSFSRRNRYSSWRRAREIIFRTLSLTSSNRTSEAGVLSVTRIICHPTGVLIGSLNWPTGRLNAAFSRFLSISPRLMIPNWPPTRRDDSNTDSLRATSSKETPLFNLEYACKAACLAFRTIWLRRTVSFRWKRARVVRKKRSHSYCEKRTETPTTFLIKS